MAAAFPHVLALVGGAAVDVIAGASGIHPVLNAEGNPTVTLALTPFLAPLLFWAGGTLPLLRVVGALLRRSGRLTGVLGRLLGPGGELAGRSLTARAAAASWAVGFATSVLSLTRPIAGSSASTRS